MEGKVKSFSPKHGYGFLIGDSDEIFFFHAREWESRTRPLRGMRVAFTPTVTEKGMRATNIRRLKDDK